jgi:hypothetical protein
MITDLPPGYVAKTGLESMPVVWGDTALANASGTSAMATGADNANSAKQAMNTPPETISDKGFFSSLFDVIDTSIYGGLGLRQIGVSKEDQARKTAVAQKTFVWSILFIVIGLMIISRGFGLIGEEGAGVLVDIADPAKYPGIGHAIQHIKKGKK